MRAVQIINMNANARYHNGFVFCFERSGGPKRIVHSSQLVTRTLQQKAMQKCANANFAARAPM